MFVMYYKTDIDSISSDLKAKTKVLKFLKRSRSLDQDYVLI